MSCSRPLKAYWAPDRKIVFRAVDGYADRHLELACGQCAGCRLARVRSWGIRAVHEAQMHEANSFITLTYDPEHLPDDGSLKVRDWQLFAKRVRKELGPFRFLHCGEYGPANLRPHYHACIFGLDFSEDRQVWKVSPRGDRLYTSERLAELWGKGFATIGELTFDSAAYVAQYCMKKAGGETAKTKYERIDTNTGECWDVKPEYATMSRRPGLGQTWFERYVDDVYPDDEVVIEGKKFRPPKYYDQLLEKRNPQLMESIKKKRIQHATKEVNDEDRLRAKETVLEAKLALKRQRNLARN